MASHLSAAFLLGMVDVPSGVHVTVPVAASNRNGLAVVHRAGLVPIDRTVVGVIPSTTPARTLVDLAGVLVLPRYEEVLDAAIVGQRVRPDQVWSALDRCPLGPGRRGASIVRHALGPWDLATGFESVMEVRLLRRLRGWGFPVPVGQHQVFAPDGSFVARIDLAWPEHRVGLEYLGKLAHAPRRGGP